MSNGEFRDRIRMLMGLAPEGYFNPGTKRPSVVRSEKTYGRNSWDKQARK